MCSEELRYGKAIVKAVGPLDSTYRVAAAIRHSIRGPITPEEPDVPLTEEGRTCARLFGRLLPWNGPLLVRTSSMRRCTETSEEVMAGYQEGHPESTATMLGSELSIAAMLHSDKNQPEMGELGKLMERRAPKPEKDWNLPTDLVDFALVVAEDTIRRISSLLKDTPPGSLLLFVDHDFHLMILRDKLFGGELKRKRWVGYLDGLVVAGHSDELFAMWGDKRTTLAFSI